MSSQNSSNVTVLTGEFTSEDQATKNGQSAATVVKSKGTSAANVPGSTASVADPVGLAFPSFPFGGMKQTSQSRTP